MNLSEMRERVRQLSGYDEDDGFITDSFILNAINDGLDDMGRRELFSVRGHIKLIADQKDYTFPPKFISLTNDPIELYKPSTDEFTLVEEGDRFDLERVKNSVYYENTSFSTGGRYFCTRHDKRITLENYTPSADEEVYLRFRYNRYHEHLSEDTDIPMLLAAEAHIALVYYALAQVALRDKEENEYQRYFAMYASISGSQEEQKVKNKSHSTKLRRARSMRRGLLGGVSRG